MNSFSTVYMCTKAGTYRNKGHAGNQSIDKEVCCAKHTPAEQHAGTFKSRL